MYIQTFRFISIHSTVDTFFQHTSNIQKLPAQMGSQEFNLKESHPGHCHGHQFCSKKSQDLAMRQLGRVTGGSEHRRWCGTQEKHLEFKPSIQIENTCNCTPPLLFLPFLPFLCVSKHADVCARIFICPLKNQSPSSKSG